MGAETHVVGNPWKNWLFVRLPTDEGLHGIGGDTLNGFARAVEAAIHELEHRQGSWLPLFEQDREGGE